MKKLFTKSIKVAFFALLFSAVTVLAQWTPPTGSPSTTNAPTPINTSTSGQIKSGAIGASGYQGNGLYLGAAPLSSIPSGGSIFMKGHLNATGLPLGNVPAGSLLGKYFMSFGDSDAIGNIHAGLSALSYHGLHTTGSVAADWFCLRGTGNGDCISAWPAPAALLDPGTLHDTLRWNGTKWIKTSALKVNETTPLHNEIGISGLLRVINDNTLPYSLQIISGIGGAGPAIINTNAPVLKFTTGNAGLKAILDTGSIQSSGDIAAETGFFAPYLTGHTGEAICLNNVNKFIACPPATGGPTIDPGTLDYTLRWDGTKWANNGNLQNSGTKVSAGKGQPDSAGERFHVYGGSVVVERNGQQLFSLINNGAQDYVQIHSNKHNIEFSDGLTKANIRAGTATLTSALTDILTLNSGSTDDWVSIISNKGGVNFWSPTQNSNSDIYTRNVIGDTFFGLGVNVQNDILAGGGVQANTIFGASVVTSNLFSDLSDPSGSIVAHSPLTIALSGTGIAGREAIHLNTDASQQNSVITTNRPGLHFWSNEGAGHNSDIYVRDVHSSGDVYVANLANAYSRQVCANDVGKLIFCSGFAGTWSKGPGSYTFTVPANIFNINIKMWGAGGGGGGGTGALSGGGNGGGGLQSKLTGNHSGSTYTLIANGGGGGEGGDSGADGTCGSGGTASGGSQTNETGNLNNNSQFCTYSHSPGSGHGIGGGGGNSAGLSGAAHDGGGGGGAGYVEGSLVVAPGEVYTVNVGSPGSGGSGGGCIDVPFIPPHIFPPYTHCINGGSAGSVGSGGYIEITYP